MGFRLRFSRENQSNEKFWEMILFGWGRAPLSEQVLS